MSKRKAPIFLLIVSMMLQSIAPAFADGNGALASTEITEEEAEARAVAVVRAADIFSRQIDLFGKICLDNDNNVLSRKIVLDPAQGSLSCEKARELLKKQQDALIAIEEEIKAEKEQIRKETPACSDPTSGEPMSAAECAALSQSAGIAAGTVAQGGSPSCSAEQKKKLDEESCFYEFFVNAPPSSPQFKKNGCFSQLVHTIGTHFINNMKGYREFFGSIGEWTSEKWGSLWKKSAPLEDATADELMTAETADDGFLEMFKKDKIRAIKTLAKNIWKALGETIKQNYGCEEWDGPPNGKDSKCVKTMSSWACATCHQKINATCGVIAVVGEEAMEIFVTALVTRGVATAVKGLAVVIRGKSALVYLKLLEKVPGLARADAAISGVAAKGAARLGRVKAMGSAAAAALKQATVVRTQVALSELLRKTAATPAGQAIAKYGAPVVATAVKVGRPIAKVTLKIVKSPLNPFVVFGKLWKAGDDAFFALLRYAKKVRTKTALDAAGAAAKVGVGAEAGQIAKGGAEVDVALDAKQLGHKCTEEAAEKAKAGVVISNDGTKASVHVEAPAPCESKDFPLK